jgi:formylmethanofuran dehydrogenase subunit B
VVEERGTYNHAWGLMYDHNGRQAVSTSPASGTLHVSPVVCTGCGCCCDDIVLPASVSALSESTRLCERGVEYFRELPGLVSSAWVGGKPVALEEAISEAARILAAANAPALAGLALVTVETCAAAVRLAALLRGWLCPWPADPTRSWGQLAPDLAMSRAEVEQAADLVLYVGCEPDALQPRHRERHLRRGLGSQRRQLFLSRPDLAEVIALRLHFEKGEPLPEAVSPLGEAIRAAACVQIYFERTLARREPALVEQWQTLAAKERRQRRFGVAILGGSGQSRTATEALTWLTGYPGPLWFAGARPLYRPGVGEIDVLLQRGGLDTVLWLGRDPRCATNDALRPAAGVRQIDIGMRPDTGADVAIQMPGLDPRLDAHVVREDGILLRLAGANAGIPDPLAALLDKLTSTIQEAAS